MLQLVGLLFQSKVRLMIIREYLVKSCPSIEFWALLQRRISAVDENLGQSNEMGGSSSTFFAITSTFVVNAYANAQILYYKHWKDYHVGLRFWWNLISLTRDTEPPPPPLRTWSAPSPLPRLIMNLRKYLRLRTSLFYSLFFGNEKYELR